jgi:hypothetical protein
LIGIFVIRIKGLVSNNGHNSGNFHFIMANSPVDKGKGFVESGMRLITERNSDKLLRKAKDLKEKSNNSGSSGEKS